MVLKKSRSKELAGDRLNKILDHCNFHSGHGRGAALHRYLCATDSGKFSDLKNKTVSTWLRDTTPNSIDKAADVLNALNKEFEIAYDISILSTYWKMGGYSPFGRSSGLTLNSNHEKLNLTIASMIKENLDDNEFKAISDDKLKGVRKKVLQLAEDFADPRVTDFPEFLLRLAVIHYLGEKD